MSAIAKAVVTHGFEEMDLTLIHALVMVENTASCWLLEKLGFHRRETLPGLRQCAGVLRDLCRYERTR